MGGNGGMCVCVCGWGEGWSEYTKSLVSAVP